MHRNLPQSQSRRAGFTLSEILLAMLVFTIAISTILALLARSIEAVDEIVVKDEAMRISSALEQHLQSMSFNNVFGEIRNNTVYQAFHYRVGSDQSTPRIDRTGAAGVDYFVVPFIGTGQTAASNEFRAREGRFFLVKLTVSPTNPLGTSLPVTADTYMSAALVIYAEFFTIGSPGSSIPANATPVYAYNFAVRR